MTRLMSVSHTEAQVRDRTKTVTRRLGWRFVKVGDRLTLCRKVMGRSKPCRSCDAGLVWTPTVDGNVEPCPKCGGTLKVVEPLVRIVDVEVIAVSREQLDAIVLRPGDVAKEGFPDWTAQDFIRFFTQTFNLKFGEEVTRIEWRYL